MKFSQHLGVVLCTWLGVCGAKAFLYGPHRAITPEFISRCPESYRAIPYDELEQKSVEELREIKANYDAPEGLGELPCGGVPVDEGNVREVAPGDLVPISWRVVEACSSKCMVTLMCPSKAISKVVWTGECGSKLGAVDIQATVPSDASECKVGECFLQWKMITSTQKTYFGCVDIKIGAKRSVEESTSCSPSSDVMPTTTCLSSEETATPCDHTASTCDHTATSEGAMSCETFDVPTGTSDVLTETSDIPTETSDVLTETPDVSTEMPNVSTEIPEASTITITETVTMTETNTIAVTETLQPSTETSTVTSTVTETFTETSTETTTATITETQPAVNTDTLTVTETDTMTVTETQVTTVMVDNGSRKEDRQVTCTVTVDARATSAEGLSCTTSEVSPPCITPELNPLYTTPALIMGYGQPLKSKERVSSVEIEFESSDVAPQITMGY